MSSPKKGAKPKEPAKKEPEVVKKEPEPVKKEPEPAKKNPEPAKKNAEPVKKDLETAKKNQESSKKEQESSKKDQESSKKDQLSKPLPNTLKPKSRSPDSKPITPSNAPVVKELSEPPSKSLKSSKDSPQRSLPPKYQSPHKFQSTKNFSPSEEIENKIKSRKRLLDTLKEQSEFCTDEMLLQLSSRDSIIEELNAEIVQLKTKIKGHSKVKESEENYKAQQNLHRITELESEKTQLESKLIIMSDKHRNEIQKFEEEKTQFELLQETMTEEIDLLRTQLKNKDEEVHGVVGDIKKLSEIIQQFKGLNHDLNQKIEKQNQEYENMSTKFYETEVKASSLADLEINLQDYIRIYQQSDSRANKASEELRSVQIIYEDLQAFCKFCEGSIGEVIEELEEGSPLAKKLFHIKQELGKKTKIQVHEVDEHVKDVKIRELSEKLEHATRELKFVENSQKPLREQVEGAMDLLQVLKKEHASSVENLNKSLKALQDHSDALKAEIQQNRADFAKKDLKITSLSSKLFASENKLLQFEEKLKKASENNSFLEKDLSEHKQKFLVFKSQITEKNTHIGALEKQNSKYVQNIQSLHEEFWKKDTALIKSKKANLQLQKSISEMSTELHKSAMPKHSDQHDKLLKELYDKEQKIEILKEMVKSSQSKSGKKAESLSPDMSIQDIAMEKSRKSGNDLVNSLASKTINKFFTICSFHRGSPQDSPPDMQRLLKKLRQDLKSYSVFSTKDLQTSVPQLSQVLNEAKAHLNLDEVLVAISKAVNIL